MNTIKEAGIQHLYPGNIIGEILEMPAVDEKRNKDVAFTQSLKVFAVRALKIGSCNYVEKEGEISEVIVNKGTAFEKIIWVKSQKQILQEAKEKMKAEEAAKNGNAPKNPISMGGKLYPTVAEAAQVAMALNAVSFERIKKATEMIQEAEQSIDAQQKQLEGKEFYSQPETIVSLAKIGGKPQQGPRPDGSNPSHKQE